LIKTLASANTITNGRNSEGEGQDGPRGATACARRQLPVDLALGGAAAEHPDGDQVPNELGDNRVRRRAHQKVTPETHPPPSLWEWSGSFESFEFEIARLMNSDPNSLVGLAVGPNLSLPRLSRLQMVFGIS